MLVEWNFSCCRATLPSSGLQGPALSESELLSNLGREGKGAPSELSSFPSGLSAMGWGKPWRKQLHPIPLSWTLRAYQRLWEVPQKLWFTQDYSVLFEAQMVKNLHTVQETWVWSPDWEDPLKKGVATHSSILAWRIPWTEEPGGLRSMESERVRHNWATDFIRPQNPLPILCIWMLCCLSLCASTKQPSVFLRT